MMPNLAIAATAATPEINFLFDRHWLSLRGESYPENAQAFYGPILEAVQHYLAQLTATPITVEVQLAYFNSRGVEQVEEIEPVEEKVTFTPPPELAREMARRGVAS